MQNWKSEYIKQIIAEAEQMKASKKSYSASWTNTLAGKNIVLYFEKPSLRTYLTFDIAIKKLGGNPVYFDNSKQMGREPDKDIIRNISRWADGIIARVYKQDTLETFVKEGTIPVINALSDKFHPCQALADYMTIKELTKKDWKDIKVAYIGEPNNVSNSLMICGAKLGAEVAIVSPASMSPDFLLLQKCKKINPKIYKTSDINDIKNYDVVYTDTWHSMGEENSDTDKDKILQPYQVNKELLELTEILYVLHCLPCHRGQEITDEVVENHPEIYQLAENRLWTEMALLNLIF